MALARALLLVFMCLPLLAAGTPLRVVMDENYPPFVHRNPDGSLEGYSVELWRLWEKKTGVRVEILAVNWAQVQPMLQRGEADVIDPIFRTGARAQQLDFSAPYTTVSTAVYADATIAGVHDMPSLRGFEVGVQAGDACADQLRRAGVDGVRTFPSYDALVAAVADRSIKLFCMDDYSADNRLYRLGLQRHYVKAFEVTREGLRWAVRKGNVGTMNLVEDGMAKIGRAEREALHDKWMGRPLMFTRNAERLAQALVALAGVLLLLLLWLATVRRAVRLRTAELEREKAQLRTLFESSPDLIWLKDTAGVYRACNAGTATQFGRPREDIIGRSDAQLHEPAVAERARREDEAALRAGGPVTSEIQVNRPGAHEERVFETIKTAVVQPDGAVLGVLGVARDITERRKLEQSMRMADLIYRTSLEAIVVTDEANRIVDANPAFSRQTGYLLAEALGARPALFESSMHDSCFYERMWQDLQATDHWQGEILDRNKDGAYTAKFVNIRLIRHPDGAIYRHVIQFHDISEQKQKDELIWRQTNFDALTGLPNRRLFFDRLEQDLKKAQGAGRGLGVLLLDLDRFKEINDSYGHVKGDGALVELTRRLAACVPGDTTIARLGGNMFALVLAEFEGRPHLETAAEAMIRAVGRPLLLGPGEEIRVSASVGISVFPDDGATAADLLRNAEHAAYLAKDAGGGRFQYFLPSLQQEAREKLMLARDLREALARRQLQVHYQPIVETATGRIRKAEALLRWFHPGHGPISPARFIPLAEESGLIEEIGDWVLSEAIAATRDWQRRHGCVVEVSVNISPLQFQRRDDPRAQPWLERIVSAGLPPDSITVEITEGVLVSDTAQVRQCLRALHAAGAKVSIDDFGTGFSSLAYLKHFDVDYLKIDKSFIDTLDTDSGNDTALVEAIIDLAHRLGIRTIAEGVERQHQRELLARFGCDYIQGYLYSPAVDGAAFEAFLTSGLRPPARDS
jgi:diguanylate cyclase (GGDEF)-like protein/PAS domain S-box-containing protein